jgi:hypothetical protein
MIARHLLKSSQFPAPGTAQDPWKASTSAWSTSDEWAQNVAMPDFSLMPEEQIEDLLPQPLRDNFRLSQSYVQLIELARQIPSDQLLSMTETVRRGAEHVRTLNEDFSHAVSLLASALEDCHDQESNQLRRFHQIQEQFETFSEQNRELFLATLREVCEACQPLVR